MDEFTEALAPTDTEIDAAWNDEETAVEDEGEQEPLQPDADQPKAEEPAKEPEAEKPTDEQVPEEKQAEADQPITFTLKHLDEVKTVDKDEIIKLAQQGMDYERIRAERDQLRTYRNEADPALGLVKAYAEKNGMNITEYVDFCRKNELLSSGLDEKNATAQLAIEKQQATMQAEQEAKTAAEKQQKAAEAETQQKADARKAEMARFFQKFPTVKPAEIPKEVWADVAKGDTLVTAYTEYRSKQLEAELAAERQNKTNVQKSTGSLTTKGAGKQDEIDRYWNED